MTDPTTIAALARLDAQLTELGARIADLEQAVTALAGPGDAAATTRAWWWPDLNRLDATAAWGHLGAWVRDALLERHPAHELTLRPCWRRHPDVVDELTALRVVWLDAYDNPQPTATAAAEYLRRVPVTMERINSQLGGCRAGRDASHQDRTRSAYQHWDGDQVAKFITGDVQDRAEPTSPGARS